MHKMIKITLLCSFFGFFGCNVPSKTALEGVGGRNAYNIAVEKTNSEEMLLNLVRLKYYDVPYFLGVGSITNQYTLKSSTSAGISIPGFDNDNPFKLNGDFSWQNQPTIQYAPLGGQAFTEQLLFPIRLTTIQQLIYTGWDVHRVFRLMIQEFDDLRNTIEGGNIADATEPQYAKFYRATELLRYFQRQGKLQVGIQLVPCETNHGNIIEVLQIAFPANEKNSEELANLLSSEKFSDDKYLIRLRQGFDKRGRIGVMSRSLLSCMYYLSLGVDVPESDYAEGKVMSIEESQEELKQAMEHVFDLIKVKSSASPPKNAYIRIKYRSHWYYIDDTDLNSKRTFLLLMQLYQLQSKESTTSAPILSLPLG